MFKFRDLIFFTIAAAFVLCGWFQVQQYHWLRDNSQSIAIHHADSRRRMAALLDQQWVSFQIPADSVAVRILSNATVDEDDQEPVAPTLGNANLGFRYALEFQILDQNSTLLRQGVYNFRSAPTEKRERESGETFRPIQVAESDALVTQTRIMQLPLENGLEKARVVRIRKAESDEEVINIFGRALCKSQLKGHTRYGAWDRISDPRKESLTRHSVYQHQLLDQRSREELLKWKWSRAVPLGEIENRYLYLVGDNDDPEVTPAPLPRGAIVFEGSKVVVPVSDQPTSFRVEALPLDDGKEVSGNLDFTWIDPATREPVHETRTFQRAEQPAAKFVEIQNVVGLVELQAHCPAALRFWRRSDDDSDWSEIEFDPDMSQTFVADQRPVSFQVSHFENEMTPLKVAFRFAEEKLFDADKANQPFIADREISWRYLNAEGKIELQGTKTLQATVSAHESIWKDRTSFAVTDPVQLWFPVPPQVKKVEFWSDDSRFLVNAYARPNELLSQTRVPEDYSVLPTTESPNRRWFVLRPENYQQHIFENRMVAFKVQSRLPEPIEQDDLEELAWNRYVPNGDWLATQIFVPAIDPLEASTDEELESQWLWQELTSSSDVNFSLLRRSSHYRNVGFTFVSKQPAGRIRILCNGQVVSEKAFASSRGEFTVKLPQTQGVLTAQFGDGVRLFASGIESDLPNSAAFYSRKAIRVGDSKTSFEYEKTTWEEESLTLTLYRDQSEQNRARVTTRVVPHHGIAARQTDWMPRESWTIRNRSFDVQPMAEARSLLIDRPGKLDAGSRCFIHLGNDLPPGKYSIEVQREDSSNGYLLLYQMAPNAGGTRQIHIHDNPEQL